jgi:hypothetical protein
MSTPPIPENSQPERNVVAVPWRDELAQQPDDDACDDHTDEIHRRPLSPDLDGLVPQRCRHTRPAQGSTPAGTMAHLRLVDPSLNTCGTASTFRTTSVTGFHAARGHGHRHR